MKAYLYRASNLKSTITFWPQFHGGSQFLETATTYDFFIIIIPFSSSSTSSDRFAQSTHLYH